MKNRNSSVASWLHGSLWISNYVNGEWDKTPLESASVNECNTEFTTLTSTGASVNVRVEKQDDQAAAAERTVYLVEMSIGPDNNGQLSGFLVHIPVRKALHCVWKSHLAPEYNMTIGDKAFRSPAIVMEGDDERLALIPDLQALSKERVIPHVMDYVLDGNELYYGLSHYQETGHVYYKLDPQSHVISKTVSLRFYIVTWDKSAYEDKRDFRPVEAFIWESFASQQMKLAESPQQVLSSLEIYPRYTYEWALDRWHDVCWQQFKIGEQEVGGVVFLVTAKQKPGQGKEDSWREPKSLWNQAWFCSLRSAYGYWQAGQRFGRTDWVEKAELALEFALSAPQTNGLFPGYFQAGPNNEWETGQWYMSGPRRPEHHEHYVHLLDSSWTCYWLLKWYKDLRQDHRILDYVGSYVERLVTLQRDDGGFPAWVRPDTLECSPYLQESPETSVHAMLLCLLYEVDPRRNYIKQAEEACHYVYKHIVPLGRWEDFETYWSCSKQWEGKRYGVKDPRSGLYNQCNFGMYWTVEAAKALYQTTGEPQWLDKGERVLAEISLYQQIWEPEYIDVPSLGGFGVMTSDDEWNDARQSLFALTYFDYYRLTGNETYLTRSMRAMQASFYMMYCPENERVMKLYNDVHPHFDDRDYGFHMENFNHHDGTSVKGLGEFTIFDWGCGAASSTYWELAAKLQQIK